MKLKLCAAVMLLSLVSCSDFLKTDSGNVILKFSPYLTTPFTKSEVPLEDVFSKLNIMVFTESGEKAFDKVKTQNSDDDNFGTLSLTLPEGKYQIVAVGHSSTKSATIKSPTQIQFTAADGEKLTDTFSYYGTIEVSNKQETHDLKMTRVVAMFRLKLTDTEVPSEVVKMKFEYTGGSANYNAVTGQGITKSSQTENRNVSSDNIYEVYTFPYMSDTGELKVTVSALDNAGNVIKSRVFEKVPITVNMITEYKGQFFSGSEVISGSTYAFGADPQWAGTNSYEF